VKLKNRTTVLIAVSVALILSCGGDPEDPPPGSIWEKLCGKWTSDPIPRTDGSGETDTITIEMSYWSSGLTACYPSETDLRSGKTVGEFGKSCSTSGFIAQGLTAVSSSSQSEDGTTWHFRIDPNRPDVIYATWTLQNGTKRIDNVKFHWQRK
jgi:hypothetical protein